MGLDNCSIFRGSRCRRALVASTLVCFLSAAASLAVMPGTAPAAVVAGSYECNWVSPTYLHCRDLFSGTEWLCQEYDGELLCAYRSGPQPLSGDKQALEDALAGNPAEIPARPQPHGLTISTAYDPNGPHHATSSATGTRTSTGTSWEVIVTIDGAGQATQSCSSASTSCTATVGAYLDNFQYYTISATSVQGGFTWATAEDGVFAYCD